MASQPDNVTPVEDQPQLAVDPEESTTAEVTPEAPAEAPAEVAPVTTPASTPEVAPEPEATPESVPAEDALTRERDLQSREQQMAAYEAQHQRQQVEAQAHANLRAYHEQLTASGMDPDQVNRFVQREQQQNNTLMQARAQLELERDTIRGQHNAAKHYSAQYGISYEEISDMSTPQEMEAAGKSFKANTDSNTRIAKLEAELAAQKQGTVPADQVFDDGTGSSPQGKEERRKHLSDLPRPLTDAEHAEFKALIGLQY